MPESPKSQTTKQEILPIYMVIWYKGGDAIDGSAGPEKLCGKGSIDGCPHRMKAATGRLGPPGVIPKECFDHLLVFFRFQAAGAVHQNAAWADA
jgi:hypothetical protein